MRRIHHGGSKEGNMKHPLTWVMVADGGAARVYRTTGETGAHQRQLELVPGGAFSRLDHAQLGPHSSENSPRSARDSGHGASRQTPAAREATKRRAEEEFIATVLAWIGKPEHLAAFERLIIAAPPRTLGEIRAALSPALKERIHGEIHGDLTKLPIKELEQRVLASSLSLAADRGEAS